MMKITRLSIGTILAAVVITLIWVYPALAGIQTDGLVECSGPQASSSGSGTGDNSAFNAQASAECPGATASPSPEATQSPRPRGGNPLPPKPTPTPTLAQLNEQAAPCGWNVTHATVTSEGGTTAITGTNANARACPGQPAPVPALTPATSPPPDLSSYYAKIFEQIQTSPGAISAAPPNHTGLVNLPACFWLTGQAVPGQTQVTMDLKGAPNSAGKQITYHITLTVALQQPLTWDFGDGSSTQTPAPTDCVGISGDPLSLVAHDYVTYSDGDFMVTASETYAGSVTMTWTDDNGPESQTVAGPTQTITTPAYPIKVDQEEGLGIG